jgi:cysteine desulfurase
VIWRVVDAMIPWLREHFGNPASTQRMLGAGKRKKPSRKPAKMWPTSSVPTLAKSSGRSGATESNNLALKGAAQFSDQSRGKHLITVKTEHKAVLDTMRELERQGFEVTYLDVQDDGLVNIDVFKAALRPDTILVSVMLVNNEIGVIQDIPGHWCHLP